VCSCTTRVDDWFGVVLVFDRGDGVLFVRRSKTPSMCRKKNRLKECDHDCHDDDCHNA
jgi:hypothetical protein